MATTTTNFGLTKPGTADNADITVIDTDLDQIDTQMKTNADAAASAQTTANTAQSNLTTHEADMNNPHQVTAAQAGAIANAGSFFSGQIGTSASKPAAGTSGRIYIETDTARIMRDDGTAWQVTGVVNWTDLAGKPTTVATSGLTDAETINDAQAKADAVQTNLNAHINDTVGAHAASAISVADVAAYFTATDVEGVLAELFQNVSDGKISVAAAITGMGQVANGSMTFAQLAAAISAISNDANAAVADVLAGYTFYQGGSKKTGTMPNNGALGTYTPGTTNQSIPAGYSGGGTVAGDPDLVAGNVKSGVNIFGVVGNVIQASGNAGAAQVLSGYSASNASGGFSGSMPNNGAPTWTPGTGNQGLAAGYYSGGTVQGDANLVASNIIDGMSLFGVVGTAPYLIYKYHDGVEDVAWVKGIDTGAGTLTNDITNGYLDLAASNSNNVNNESAAVTNVPVDLTNVSVIIIYWDNAGSSVTANGSAFVIGTGKNDSYANYTAGVFHNTPTIAGDGLINFYNRYDILDVSSYTGSYYLRMHACTTNNFLSEPRLRKLMLLP